MSHFAPVSLPAGLCCLLVMHVAQAVAPVEGTLHTASVVPSSKVTAAANSTSAVHQAGVQSDKAQAAASVSATNTSQDEYAPTTQFDNTPWRFNMNQEGKKMTAEQFDAWMKAKGIHVVKAHAPAAAAAATTAVVQPVSLTSHK